MKRDQSVLKSLSRGVEVLKCFTPEAPRQSLTAIAARLGIPKGSAFRLVATLEQLGFLEQDPETKQYRLGIKVLALSQAHLAGLEYPGVALPHLEELAIDTQESASMAVLDGNEIVYVARASIRRVMSSNLMVGSRLPSYCTSMGKVLLAHLEDEELDRTLASIRFDSYTHRTIADAAALKATLPGIREQGYAVSDRELERTLRSIAAPVYGPNGEAVAAINVSTFALRVADEELQRMFIPRLLETAHTISNALGYKPGARAGNRVAAVAGASS